MLASTVPYLVERETFSHERALCPVCPAHAYQARQARPGARLLVCPGPCARQGGVWGGGARGTWAHASQAPIRTLAADGPESRPRFEASFQTSQTQCPTLAARSELVGAPLPNTGLAKRPDDTHADPSQNRAPAPCRADGAQRVRRTLVLIWPTATSLKARRSSRSDEHRNCPGLPRHPWRSAARAAPPRKNSLAPRRSASWRGFRGRRGR